MELGVLALGAPQFGAHESASEEEEEEHEEAGEGEGHEEGGPVEVEARYHVPTHGPGKDGVVGSHPVTAPEVAGEVGDAGVEVGLQLLADRLAGQSH